MKNPIWKRLQGNGSEKAEKYSLNHKEEWENVKAVVDQIFEDTKDRRKEMTDYLKLYRGKIWNMEQLDEEDSRIMYNMIFTTISSIAPLVTDSKPISSVVPKFPFLQNMAEKYTLALKYGWETLDMQMVLTKGCIWAYICGYVVYHLYYDPTKQFGGSLCCEIIDPRDFFVAPGYEEIWKAPYCGYKTRKPISWVKQFFPGREIKPDVTFFGEEDDTERAYKMAEVGSIANEAQFITVYCVWMKDESLISEEVEVETEAEDEEKSGEKREGKKTEKVTRSKKKYPNGKFMYFTDSEFLGEMPQEELHGLPPFVEQIDYYNPGMFSAIGEVDQIRGLDLELNLQLQALANNARATNGPNYEVDVDQGLDIETFKQTYRKGNQVYSVNKSGSQAPAIRAIESGDLTRDVYTCLSLIPKVVEDVTGVTETGKGIASKKERQSASELAILAEAGNTRTRLKIRFLEWTIRRISYLLVRLMQQYYVDPRMVVVPEDESTSYLRFSSTKDTVVKTIISPEVRDKIEGKLAEEIAPLLNDDEKEQYADYVDFCRVYDEIGPNDPVYFDFDIDIQTDSTLPLDKQSRANLMLRLFQFKAIDEEALLSVLQIPGWEKTVERIKKTKAAAGDAAKQKLKGALMR